MTPDAVEARRDELEALAASDSPARNYAKRLLAMADESTEADEP